MICIHKLTLVTNFKIEKILFKQLILNYLSKMTNNFSDTKKNLKLDSPEVKQTILKYLATYNIKNLSINEISNDSEINYITNNDYIVCPQFIGVRSWFIIKKFGDFYYAVMFPKKTHKNSNITLYPIKLALKAKLYEGTIMEGICHKYNEERYMIVDDVYLLQNINQLIFSKSDRLDKLTDTLNECVMHANMHHLYVSQRFNLSQNDLSDLYEKIKLDNRIDSLAFFPNVLNKPIFKYTIVEADLVDDIVKFSTFIMKKATLPDVYHLFVSESTLSYHIASVPDQHYSKLYRKWFKGNKCIRVKCKMSNDDEQSWIPIEIIDIPPPIINKII